MELYSSTDINKGVVVIRMDNPPVNSLSHHLREFLYNNVEKAINDDSVEAIVLYGENGIFCGGADIRQFNTPLAIAKPSLFEILDLIESSPKPVIAAVSGVAYGGGFELALTAHYRVVSDQSKLALTEVNLGLIPGGGGTQRLPRLIGVKKALDMILTGKPAIGQEAVTLGLANKFIEGDLIKGVVKYYHDTIKHNKTHPIISKTVIDPDSVGDYFDKARVNIAHRKRGFVAPKACITAIEAAVNLPFTEGLKKERELFLELISGSEYKALTHLFFAERAAGKIAGIDPKQQTRPINQVGIVGAGTMGVGISMTFADNNIPIKLVEVTQERLDRGLQMIKSQYESAVERGRITAEMMQQRLNLIVGYIDYQVLADVDLVIEAVFEEMEVKKAVFQQLDKVCRSGAILASNTSRLNINEIAKETKRPKDVIGLHFFSPANVMRLLEVVRGDKTADDVIVTAMKLAKRIRKQAVLVGVCDGFVGNRMLTPYMREAQFLLEEGASVSQVDQTLYEFGMAMGPLAVGDLAGLDIGWAARKSGKSTRPQHLRYSDIADKICEMGRFGQKTGSGFYRYEKGSRTPIPDPEIEVLIEKCARNAGITRVKISNEEIIQRCIYALINEGAKILEEGIAARASDIDIVYVNGYGFPAYLGGPMFYASSIGLKKVYAKVLEYQKVHGEYWDPAPLLKKLAEENKTFNDYDAEK